jgi:hypothetical protein
VTAAYNYRFYPLGLLESSAVAKASALDIPSTINGAVVDSEDGVYGMDQAAKLILR